MARKISDRERIEEVFSRAELAEATHLLDIAGVIMRSRFPQKEAVKRGRKAKVAKTVPPTTIVSAA